MGHHCRLADTGLRGGHHENKEVGDHKACLWDVISDLPHASNSAYLGMINTSDIAPPRSVFQVQVLLRFLDTLKFRWPLMI